ncbi:MAG TPA: carbohydrate kinase family protein [Anaerolineaceae bacterium]|nr:carbohydrate kinase family protein [Anaerolineaceae bacterium]
MSLDLNRIPEVAVLGAAAMDWIAQVQELPHPDSIVFAEHYAGMVGGTGGNVAEGIARLGHRVRFLGVLGDDENGKRLMDAFIRAEVDTSAVQVRKGEHSAATFIARDHQGQRIIFGLGGAALYERAEDIDPLWLKGIRILFIADAYPEPALAAIRAMESGAKVIFNPGGLMVASGEDFLGPIVERCDALLLSREEACQLSGEADPESAAVALSRKGRPVVLITLGSEGALLREQAIAQRIPACQAESVVDTTGAGDAFASGVVSGILRGFTWADAARLGCAVASIKIDHTGARGGLPDWEQVQAKLGG